MKLRIGVIGLLAVMVGACAPAAAPSAQVPSAGAPAIQRTLVIGSRGQPPTFAAKPIVSFSGSLQEPRTLLNAGLDFPDERGVTHPILQEALLQLNTASWKVFPDGTMETTYQLKPNLTWHDGQPLSSEDFAFAWQGQYVLDASNGQTLEEQWQGSGSGEVFWAPVQPRINFVQLRPDVAQPRSQLDLRVRKALAYAMDSATAVEALSGGRGLSAGTITSPKVAFYPQIDQVTAKYPYDPKSVQQNLEAAGYHKEAGGMFADASGERFVIGLWTSSGGKNERQGQVFADGLKRAGVDATPHVIPAEALTDQSVRALAPGLHIETGPTINPYEQFVSRSIPSADNRWKGNNLGGWVSADYDRFYDAYSKSLDPNERVKAVVGMEQAFTQDVGSIPLYWDVVVTAHTTNLAGPVARETPDSAQDYRNLHLWEWRS